MASKAQMTARANFSAMVRARAAKNPSPANQAMAKVFKKKKKGGKKGMTKQEMAIAQEKALKGVAAKAAKKY